LQVTLTGQKSLAEVAEATEAAATTGGGWVNIAYLIAAVLFIMGIKGLTHPRTAVQGNLKGSLGMLLAIVATLINQGLANWWLILLGLIIGGGIGLVLAIRIQMTAMPQMVALFNGFGGLASLIVAGAELYLRGAAERDLQTLVAVAAAGLIGSVTFYGSLVAFAKLMDWRWIPDGQMFPGQTVLNAALFALSVVLGLVIVFAPEQQWAYWLMGLIVAAALGILLTQPIGGADMPVVIALLNSYSGLAATATGFVINNSVLIIAGSLVGASGLILTGIMCRAMNRSLPNVIFGTMAVGGEKMDADEIYRTVKATSAEEGSTRCAT
jgi:NAD(P) transhydrogenase subunit beta